MLNKEVLQQNEALKGLSDEQITAIEKLSDNVFGKAIGEKMKAYFDGVDSTILEITGVAKTANAKTTEYAKTAFEGIKAKSEQADELNDQLIKSKTKLEAFEKQIKAGVNDPAIKAQLEKLEQAATEKDGIIEKLRTDYTTIETDSLAKIKAAEDKNFDLRFNAALSEATKDVKFKELPAVALEAALSKFKTEIKGKGTPVFQEVDGKEVILFKDENGQTITNPNNLQNPYSAGEMYLDAIKDLIDGGVQGQGGGTKPSGGTSLPNIAGAKSQTEAMAAIAAQLKAEGIPSGTPKYTERQSEIWKESNLDALPMKSPV